MRFGAGLPMGPIALTDLVGIDTFVGIMDAIHSQFDDTRFAPRPILAQLPSAGFTGRKAGRGFYAYEEPGSSRVLPDDDVRAAGGSRHRSPDGRPSGCSAPGPWPPASSRCARRPATR